MRVANFFFPRVGAGWGWHRPFVPLLIGYFVVVSYETKIAAPAAYTTFLLSSLFPLYCFSPWITMSPHHDTLGIASLDDILKQYGANPDLLQLILVSKVQEDRRRAEEVRLRSKEIDFCIQKDTMKLPSIVHFDKSSTTTCPPADETPQSPPSHRSSSSTTTSSLGSPRSLPEQRPDPIFAPTKLPQLHHILEPQSTPRFVADRRLPTIPPAPPFGHNIPYPLVTRSST